MNKYLVEFVAYTFHWIDVGPGPAERGGISGISPICRRYRSYDNLEEIQGIIENSTNEDGFFVVSKLVDRLYTPGKLHTDHFGKLSWTKSDEFRWVRLDHSWPAFQLEHTRDKTYYGSQRNFYQKDKTFSELCSDVASRLGPEALDSIYKRIARNGLINVGGYDGKDNAEWAWGRVVRG